MVMDLVMAARTNSAAFSEVVYSSGEIKRGKNDFLILIKPEAVEEGSNLQAIFSLIASKLALFKVELHGINVFNSIYAQKHKIVEKQYHVLNSAAHNGLSQLPKSVLSKLSLEEINRTIGAFEFLHLFPDFDAKRLEVIAHQQGTKKLSNGIYQTSMIYEGVKFEIINAFHPFQLEHLYQSGSVMLALSCSTNTRFSVLADELIGFFDPSKAAAGSLRNEAFNHQHSLGLKEVSILRNCFHNSPSPLEGAISLSHYFSEYESSNVYFITRSIKELNLSGSFENKIYCNGELRLGGEIKPVFEHFEGLDAQCILQRLQLSQDDLYPLQLLE